MEFSYEIEGRTAYLRVSGDVLFTETTTLGSHLDKLLAEDFDEAVINFSEVSGITSSAIGAVIDFFHQLRSRGRRMRIQGMSEKAYSVFKYFKLDSLFPIER